MKREINDGIFSPDYAIEKFSDSELLFFLVQRNYRCFFLFVSSSALLCIFVFSMSALYMKFLRYRNDTAWEPVMPPPASVVLMAYCFVLFWFVAGLTSFHLYLIATTHVN